MIFFILLAVLVTFITNLEAFRLNSQIFRFKSSQILSLSSTDCKPGSPIIKSIDKDNNIAYMTVAISGEDTQKAFSKAVEMFNEEVKSKEYKVAGFRPGAKLPASYLYQVYLFIMRHQHS